MILIASLPHCRQGDPTKGRESYNDAMTRNKVNGNQIRFNKRGKLQSINLLSPQLFSSYAHILRLNGTAGFLIQIKNLNKRYL